MQIQLFRFIIVFSCLGMLNAQTFINKLSPTYNSQTPVILQDDTLRILGVLVNFLEDQDEATFGNGKFGSIYSQEYGTSIIDPLPHDADYFEAHLQFVKNYFEKVSGSKLHITYEILPDTFSVSQTMRNYSPLPESDDFTPLGEFASEVWTLADQKFSGFEFNNYDLFIIFHAGAGRDVILPGSLGTERDLPSLYLSPQQLKNIFGEAFNGFPVQGGQFLIPNTIIIPETESREISSFGSTFLFEISINGLLCASVGSYLGLPDLFDTETGLSAIGRFGLMDGQSIFAYNGLFPPEPSPWEKYYLGWIEPVTISPGEYLLNLKSRLASNGTDTILYKIPINSEEYFLVENRSRDVFNNGAVITYKINNQVFTKTFLKDTTGFYSFQTDSVDGVVTDVDEFDWAVPGQGILIWHIDEKIIREKIAENKVNTDKFYRGVDVEEADGIQDIGERFFTIFGDEIIGEGAPEDFWYASNPSELFLNKFGSDTRPATFTNSGANSLITFSEFSEISDAMSFKLVFGDSVVKPLFSVETDISDSSIKLATLSDGGKAFILLMDGNNLKVFDNTGNEIYMLPDFSEQKPVSFSENNVFQIYGALNDKLNYLLFDESTFKSGSVTLAEDISSPPIIRNISGVKAISLGTGNGKILNYLPASLPDINPVLLSEELISPVYIIYQIAADDENFFATAGELITDPVPVAGSYSYRNSAGFTYELKEERPIHLALTKSVNGEYISVLLTRENNIYIFSENSLINVIPLEYSAQPTGFSLGDIRNDGQNYIVLNLGGKIIPMNSNGSIADNFPFMNPGASSFIFSPICLDFEGTSVSEIISLSESGDIYALDGSSGNIISSFPLSAGPSPLTSPAAFLNAGKISLAVIDSNGVLTAWEISSAEGKLYWSEDLGNGMNTAFVDAAASTNKINEFFPKDRAYNYPNPVYDNLTYIRYYLSEDSDINIKIFDLAGDYVAELSDFGNGGMDNETVWDVSNIQSGVYLARIEAKATSGKTEVNIIKIAVVK